MMKEPSHLRLIQGGDNSSPPDGIGQPAVLVSDDFDEVFRRYAPYVAAIGCKLLGRDDELDDLVQDVFLEAHRGLARVRDAAAIKSWLATIAVRCASRRLRRQKLWTWIQPSSPLDHGDIVDPAATPEERAHVASTYRLLDKLPTGQRVVWVLHHVEGESLDAIARLCACSKSTVQRRLRAAAKALQKRVSHVRDE
jgi:RNA polymerase sigma-70 factor (ECF subfamily)